MYSIDAKAEWRDWPLITDPFSWKLPAKLLPAPITRSIAQ